MVELNEFFIERSNKPSKIENFRMAKRFLISLDFEPRCIDNYADYFLISYEKGVNIVDIFDKQGLLI